MDREVNPADDNYDLMHIVPLDDWGKKVTQEPFIHDVHHLLDQNGKQHRSGISYGSDC